MKENIPGFQSLMYPVLSYLKDSHLHSFQEVFDYLIHYFKITDDETE